MRRPAINDEAAAQRVLKFGELLRCTGSEWVGESFRWLPWQRDEIIRPLFGTKRPDGTRQYRKCFVSVAKKNGKTQIGSIIALYMLTADGEAGAEVYSAATEREQASIVFRTAAAMVEGNPVLSSRCEVIESTKTIVMRKFGQTPSIYRALSADVKTKHGYSPSCVIFDELHAQPHRRLYDVLTQGVGAARRQPLLFMMTTAGYDRASICYEVYEYAKKVQKGILTDEAAQAFLPVIYEVPEGANWEDEEVWKLANPSLGTTIQLDELRREYLEAKAIPGQQNTFRQLRLNQWVSQASRWFDLSLWDAQPENGPVAEEELEGGPCYGALDVGQVSDMTSWVMAFPDKEDPELLRFLARFWVPESALEDPHNPYREQYQVWARDKHLQVTPGNATDYDFVTEQVLRDAARFGLVDMNIDALFQGHQVATRLGGEGLEVAAFRQGRLSYTAPTKEFERRLLLRKIAHGGHPILRFNADNVALERGPGDTVKPVKGSPQGKIDGLQCMVMALDRVMRHETAKARSVYEERGIVWL